MWNRTNQPYELAGNHERGIWKKHNFSLQKVTSKHYRRKKKNELKIQMPPASLALPGRPPFETNRFLRQMWETINTSHFLFRDLRGCNEKNVENICRTQVSLRTCNQNPSDAAGTAPLSQQNGNRAGFRPLSQFQLSCHGAF